MKPPSTDWREQIAPDEPAHLERVAKLTHDDNARTKLDKLDAVLMPSSFKWGFQPNAHNVQCAFNADHTLTQ